MEDKKKILVVDDEPSIVKLASLKLEKEGYEIIAAYNGPDALKRAEQEKPDLILLDVMMPGMTGWEVHEKLKQNPETNRIPVIILTAMGQYEAQLKSLEAGVTDYMTKPFDSTRLVETVNKILKKTVSSDALDKERFKKEAKLKAIVDIMRRESGKE